MLHDIVLRDPDYLKAQGKPREYIQQQRVRVKIHKATEERVKRAKSRVKEVEEVGSNQEEGAKDQALDEKGRINQQLWDALGGL
jgi:hypothetical protein